MSFNSNSDSDLLALYKAWKDLDNGARAQLRRVTEPEKLRDIPAFYRFVQPFDWKNKDNQYPLLCMVFCLSAGKDVINHTEPDEKNPKGISLGKALADSGRINERRLYQVLRADWPNNMVQLRRLLIHAEPNLYWPALAKQLNKWNQYDRRQILEDFILALPPQKKTA